MTYADAFDKIKKKLAIADVSKLDSDFAIQVTITDEDAAGTFYVAYINGEFSVEPYDYRDNSVAIDISVDDFIKIVGGRLSLSKALADGRISTFGDAEVLNKIASIAKAPAKKPAEKKEAKPAAKKAAVKAEPKKKATPKAK